MEQVKNDDYYQPCELKPREQALEDTRGQLDEMEEEYETAKRFVREAAYLPNDDGADILEWYETEMECLRRHIQELEDVG